MSGSGVRLGQCVLQLNSVTLFQTVSPPKFISQCALVESVPYGIDIPTVPNATPRHCWPTVPGHDEQCNAILQGGRMSPYTIAVMVITSYVQ